MKLLNIYLRDGLFLIPTVAQTHAGFYMDVEPVNLAKVESIEDLMCVLKSAISKGNPIIETPTRENFPKPVLPAYAGLKSWYAFQKNALYWQINQKDSAFELRRQLKSPEGGWEDDPGNVELFVGNGAVEDLARSILAEVRQRD